MLFVLFPRFWELIILLSLALAEGIRGIWSLFGAPFDFTWGQFPRGLTKFFVPNEI